MRRRPTIVVLGMMSRMPVAGVVWQTIHYLLGFRQLGYEVAYVETHARTPSMLMEREHDDGGALAAAYVDRVLRRFDLGDRWAYVALHDDGAHYGMSQTSLHRLYRDADAIVNLHGGTEPSAEHFATGRLVYVETDPVQLQVELADGNPDTIAFLEPHCAFFTFGENYGRPDCRLPVSQRFRFLPTRQPVVTELWPWSDAEDGGFTTIANWRQPWRDVSLDGEVYTWSKHLEFERFLALPHRTGRRFELALSGCDEDERARLTALGWQVHDGLALSRHLDSYRDFVCGSLAEFTAAKDQNVRLRSGWFSDRSATYLAAGRPVVTQDTGFGVALPVGAGLHAVATADEAHAAVERVVSEYERERRAASEIAREHFEAATVLGALLDAIGLETDGRGRMTLGLPHGLEVTPRARRPLRLPEETTSWALERPVPFPPPGAGDPEASIVVVTRDNLALTRLCLESVLADPGTPLYEVVVVDNGSSDCTRSYLLTLARRAENVRVLLNDANEGFPRACNQGLALATADRLVLLNNDCIVTPGWLQALLEPIDHPSVALVGPTTNRIGNEAEIPTSYETVGGLLDTAHARDEAHRGQVTALPTPAMFCVAFARSTYELLGPLDESFGLGTLEDDDYAFRARAAGLANVCAEGSFVHHFGEGSFGALVPSGEYGDLIARNRSLFEEKWGTAWSPYERRGAGEYAALTERVRGVVERELPAGSHPIVASRGDDELLRFDGRAGMHFPQVDGGVYAGHYPASSVDAVTQLEKLRHAGGDYFVVPRPGFWWLDHYTGLREHLETSGAEVFRDDCCVVFKLGSAAA